MIELEDAKQCIGHWVVYTPHGQQSEDGEIIEVRPPYVMVKYRGDNSAKATYPRDLNWGPKSGPFA